MCWPHGVARIVRVHSVQAAQKGMQATTKEHAAAVDTDCLAVPVRHECMAFACSRDSAVPDRKYLSGSHASSPCNRRRQYFQVRDACSNGLPACGAAVLFS